MFANPDDDYNLRIIDFGLAEQLKAGESEVAINMCGTLEYMSPEVMDCKFASAASGYDKHYSSGKATALAFSQQYYSYLEEK